MKLIYSCILVYFMNFLSKTKKNQFHEKKKLPPKMALFNPYVAIFRNQNNWQHGSVCVCAEQWGSVEGNRNEEPVVERSCFSYRKKTWPRKIFQAPPLSPSSPGQANIFWRILQPSYQNIFGGGNKYTSYYTFWKSLRIPHFSWLLSSCGLFPIFDWCHLHLG